GLYTHTVGGMAYDAAQALKGTRFGNTAFGAMMRRNVLNPIGNSTALGAKRYPDVLKSREENREERRHNLERIENREDVKRLGEINKTWDKDEKDLRALQDNVKKGITLDPPAKQRLERLEKLDTERKILAKRVEDYTPSQVTALKASSLEGIIKQLTDAHVKAIKENTKYKSKEKEDILKAWNEENKKAPMGESKKQLEELRKIRETLKEKRKWNELDTLLPHLAKYLAPGKDETVKIDLKTAEDLKKSVEELRDTQETLRREGATKAEKIAAGDRERDLKKAVTHFERLIENIKKVPEHTGGATEPGAFMYKGGES
ncbi:MAG TPA: hypothetical protein VFA15_03270, partial [Nitrososphaera sp.]|nr:hypothetical protein [Nitrososphaera sp.]